MRWVGRIGAWSVALAACGDPDPFVCTDDASCSGGVCQPTGYCSFDDPECASGQRYGAHAPAQIAGTCVDTGTAETGDTTAAPSTSATTTASTLTTSAPGTTTDSADDTESLPVTSSTGDATSMTDAPSTTSSVDASSSDDTAPPMPVCRIEEFDDEFLDDWVLVQGGPTEAFVDEDLLVVDLSGMPSSAGLDPIAFGVLEGSLEVALVEAPNQVVGTQVYLGVGTPRQSYLLMLEQSMVVLRHDMGRQGFDDLTAIEWGADVLWWRIDVAAGELTFSVSDDGIGWEVLEVVAPTFALEESQWFLRAGTWTPPPQPPGYALFERVELCTLE